MSATDSTRVKLIFGEALERRGPDRSTYLDQACADDPGLRERVHVLLAAAEADAPFLSEPTAAPGFPTPPLPPPVAPAEGPGTRIGPYRILQLIGEGGFGSVFMAEQERPVYRRVALKIIKLGMDTRAVVARFEQERQALALMDHPHIAKVLDAGATDKGRPYFVMELVKGEPITHFCDKNSLAIPDRLALFVQVCQAVQHAHTKGIVHRDIKPSNILVTTQDGQPLARVIDFGIAKATDHRLTEKTVFTELRQLVGTPEYMSPEQAEGSLDIDTRTDLYSLGVILYELLTGATPFDPQRLRSAAFGELQRIIREVDPPRPSTRLSQLATTLPAVAAHRRIEPRRLPTVIRGDLDWIVMRALEKDRSRRYETASSFAADVQRYLAGQPVTAAPPGAAYHLRKFIRRHSGAVVAASIVALALVLGVIGTSIGLVQARHQRDKARAAETLANDRLAELTRANKIANSVTEFFTLDVLDLKPPRPGEPELTVRQVLERVPQKIEQHFSSEPAVEGAIRERVGQLYLSLGEPRRAADFLVPAVGLMEQGLGPDNHTTLMALHRLGELFVDLEQFDRAEAAFDKVYTARRRVLGPEHRFTLHSLVRRGYSRVRNGKPEQGLADIRAGVDEFVRLQGRASKPTLIVLRDLIQSCSYLDRHAEAESLARAALDDIRANAGDLGPAEPDFREALGVALAGQGRFDKALTEFDAAWEADARDLAPTNPRLAELRAARARALVGLDRSAEAAPELEASYNVFRTVYGESSARCREIARISAQIAAKRGDEPDAAAWRARADPVTKPRPDGR